MIVVGAGTAGIPAALFGAQNGARVLLLEKAAQVGGTLWFSGGQMSAAGTRRQAALSIDDSPERHLADILRISRGTADPALVRRAVTQAGPTLDWLDSAGFEFGPEFPLDATGHEPYSRRRIWGGTQRGYSVLKVLERELATARAKPVLVTRFDVTDLLIGSGGTVTGVRGVDESGKIQQFHAPRVVLASGGYMANPQMFAELNGRPQYRAAGWPANTGIGVTLALAAGGYTRGSQNYLCDFGSIPAELDLPSPEYARSIHHPQRRMPWEIYVNRLGQRFIREDDESIDTRERALSQQDDHRYWVVFDEPTLSAAPTLVRSAPPGEVRDWTRDELRAAFDEAPAFVRADSIEELATRAGIDPAGLLGTIRQFNDAVRNGSDSWGRRYMPRPVDTPPYYAIRHQGGTLISVAGVAVDESLRVVRPGGAPIPGLYAIGELLGNGSLSGQAFCSGMMVTPALSLGRWLGMTLSKRA
ncbi:MAG: FAD-binding protein [Gammaproteobacteria bacterium]|nr:FAD-binding protein [Gammaproteobacteria bacterium]